MQSQFHRILPKSLTDIIIKNYHNKEFRQFLYISLGSCAEVETQIVITERLKYIDQIKAANISTELYKIEKMINCLITKINVNLN